MNELQQSVLNALKQLVKNDSDLIETQPKEECINHKLAIYLERSLQEKGLLDGIDVDIEYNKYKDDEKESSNGRNIRPDILVHERRSGNRNNLIVIEAKKNYNNKSDTYKVIDLMDSVNFKYQVGALISYLPKGKYMKIKFYERGIWNIFRLNKSDLSIVKTDR